MRGQSERLEDLKTYLMNMPDRTKKQTLYIMPKLDYKPKDLEEMADCEFYIINGQHSVAASKSMIAGNVPEAILKDSAHGIASSSGRKTLTSCTRFLPSTTGSIT